jgi:hypothetical protein
VEFLLGFLARGVLIMRFQIRPTDLPRVEMHLIDQDALDEAGENPSQVLVISERRKLVLLDWAAGPGLPLLMPTPCAAERTRPGQPRRWPTTRLTPVLEPQDPVCPVEGIWSCAEGEYNITKRGTRSNTLYR